MEVPEIPVGTIVGFINRHGETKAYSWKMPDEQWNFVGVVLDARVISGMDDVYVWNSIEDGTYRFLYVPGRDDQ